ncbi:hypothetical protein CHARACLAT_028294 [Characodon lateralis]|uniref:THAP-type domain-containing protein n=1 Tax=Characodon lateralis TaxID=208331 RepID=A0ABU7CSG8_9TELE|nr:hypothetical protein [Characodon lateralis]
MFRVRDSRKQESNIFHPLVVLRLLKGQEVVDHWTEVFVVSSSLHSLSMDKSWRTRWRLREVGPPTLFKSNKNGVKRLCNNFCLCRYHFEDINESLQRSPKVNQPPHLLQAMPMAESC